MAGKDGLSDDSALLRMIMGVASKELNELFDLARLPRKMMEIERKYRLTSKDKSPDLVMTDFIFHFGKFLETQRIVVERLIPFVGIDQYFILQREGQELVFRYRIGVNRPPQLTIKFQINRGSNLVRGEIPLDIGYEQLENVRAFMAAICGLADFHQIFVIRQDGNIWITRDVQGNPIEVVVYKVFRLTSPEKLEVFAEIEALNSKDVPLPQVVKIIERYEKGLQLKEFRCEKSIAELFR